MKTLLLIAFSSGLWAQAPIAGPIASGGPGGGGGGVCPAGTTGIVQKTNGTNCVASSITDNGTTVVTTEPLSAPSFTGTGSNPFINFPSNTGHTGAAGDLWNNAGILQFGATPLNVIATPGPIFATNAQTGTYQVLAADFAACKTIPVASGTFTITLVATASQPTTGQCLTVNNYGTGTVTIARSGQNINGGTASLILPPGTALTPTGAYIVSNGTDYFAQLYGKSPPQVTDLLTGTAATYTTPLGASYIVVEACGAGGGGAGSGTTPGTGGNGGATSFGTLTANGGIGAVGGQQPGGLGGTASGGDTNIQGAYGTAGNGQSFVHGQPGGYGWFGGGGGGNTKFTDTPVALPANTCGGGPGGGSGATAGEGAGGGAGGYVRKLFAPPSTTYTYTVGAVGAAGTTGTGGTAGVAGSLGHIVVTAFFQ